MTPADVEALDFTAYSALITPRTVLASDPSRRPAFRAFEVALAAGLPLIGQR